MKDTWIFFYDIFLIRLPKSTGYLTQKYPQEPLASVAAFSRSDWFLPIWDNNTGLVILITDTDSWWSFTRISKVKYQARGHWVPYCFVCNTALPASKTIYQTKNVNLGVPNCLMGSRKWSNLSIFSTLKKFGKMFFFVAISYLPSIFLGDQATSLSHHK